MTFKKKEDIPPQSLTIVRLFYMVRWKNSNCVISGNAHAHHRSCVGRRSRAADSKIMAYVLLFFNNDGCSRYIAFFCKYVKSNNIRNLIYTRFGGIVFLSMRKMFLKISTHFPTELNPETFRNNTGFSAHAS